MSHDSTNILCRGSPGSSVLERVGLIGEEAKGHARRHFKTSGESINPAFHAWVVIKRVAVEVAEFRGIPL